MKNVELLAPAGNLEKLKIAILYGANAVFCGGKMFSLRAKANNFELEDLKEAVIFANKHNARVHVTVNIVPEDDDFKYLDDYLLTLDKIGVHVIIVSSIYIMERARELNCKFEIHVSTQQSISNHLAAKFFKETVKADRVVLARELSIDEIKYMKDNTDLEIESFIHGGMCSAYSGRCGLSNYMVNRDANKGGCAHSCRWLYNLYDNDKLVSDNTFIMASCDLESIKYIPDIIKTNVDSLKIEGRMKSLHYVASIVSVYRNIIDEYNAKGFVSKSRMNHYIKEIAKAENRVTYSGFLRQPVKNEAILKEIGNEKPTQSYLAFSLEDSVNKIVKVETKNYFQKGDKIECFMPGGKTIKTTILKIMDKDKNEIIVSNHPMDILYLKLSSDVLASSFLRKR